MALEIRVIPGEFSVCQVKELACDVLAAPFCFVGKTDEELSLVCPIDAVPEKTLLRDDGWRMFGIVGTLDFSLVGVLANISRVLADAGVGLFAVSTYNTDYILVKKENLPRALEALRAAGYEIS